MIPLAGVPSGQLAPVSTQNASSLCDDSTKCTNPLANQSSSQTTCAARSFGRLRKCLGRCLPTSLSPGKIGRGSARPWRSHPAVGWAPTSSHASVAQRDTPHIRTKAAAGGGFQANDYCASFLSVQEWGEKQKQIGTWASSFASPPVKEKHVQWWQVKYRGVRSERKVCCISQSDA